MYGPTSKSSWSGITIGSGCTRRWAIDLRKNSSERLSARPHLEARPWSFLRTKRTTKRLLKDCWGRRLKCRPFPRPLLVLGDARKLLGKRKLCPKKLCHFRGSPQKSGSEMSPFAAEYRPKPACSTQNKA